MDCRALRALFPQYIGSGRLLRTFAHRARDALGWNLGTSGSAEAAGWIDPAVEARGRPLRRRFRRQEAEGRGLRDRTAAVVAGIPSPYR